MPALGTPSPIEAGPRHHYRSTAVIAALTAAVLVLIIVPGNYHGGDQIWSHGWPWTYLTRGVDWKGPFSQPASPRSPQVVFGYSGTMHSKFRETLSVTLNPWSMTARVQRFSPWLLFADIAVGLGVLATACFLWRRWRRQRFKVCQLHIRDLLFVTAAVAVGCWWFVSTLRACRQEQAIADQLTTGRQLAFDYEPALPGWSLPWLDPAVVDSYSRVVKADFYGHVSDVEASLAQMQLLGRLESIRMRWLHANDRVLAALQQPNLRRLYLFGANVTDAGIANLVALADLETIDLSHTEITDEAIASLQGLLNLRQVSLDHTAVTDTGAGRLAAMPQLRDLSVSRTQITSEGMRILCQGLPRLENLELEGLPIRDADLPMLLQLRWLQSLDLSDTRITDEGALQLAALPHLQRLSVRDTYLTRAGAAVLKQLMPHVEIATSFD